MWKWHGGYHFFFLPKDAQLVCRQLWKKSGRKIFMRFNERHEKQNVGSKGTPPMHLSVNNVNAFVFLYGHNSPEQWTICQNVENF